MGKRGKELARERRQKRLEEISHIRQIPYPQNERWWNSDTVAVVTGSSQGIGYEIARQLTCHGVRVIITSRNEVKGRETLCKLRREGEDGQVVVNVEFHRLDVGDESSVMEFAGWVRSEYCGIDILINNAGVNFNFGSENSVEFAEKVISTNYLGTKHMIKAMMPLIKPSIHGARILNVSSRLGRVNGRRNRLGDARLREELSRSDCLSEDLIDTLVSRFMEQVKDGSWSSDQQWPQMFTDYSVSKMAVNFYTRLMAREVSDRPEGLKIYINCYCPGWVKTSMTGWQGNMEACDGADTGVWAVLGMGLSHPFRNGKFFAERREISF